MQRRSMTQSCIYDLRVSGRRNRRTFRLLVAITQTSILGDLRRRLSPREAARLQGLPEWFDFKRGDSLDGHGTDQRDAASYKQMGNGVNVGAAYHVFCKYVATHMDEIKRDHLYGMRGGRVASAVGTAPSNPDERLGNHALL